MVVSKYERRSQEEEARAIEAAEREAERECRRRQAAEDYMALLDRAWARACIRERLAKRGGL